MGCAGRRAAVTAPGLGQRFVGGVETALESPAAALSASAPLRAPFGARAEQLGLGVTAAARWNARADSHPSELAELLVARGRPAGVPYAAVPPPRSRREGVPGWEVGPARASQRACVHASVAATGGARPARHAPARRRHGRKPGRSGGGGVTQPHGAVSDRAAGGRLGNAAYPAERRAAIGGVNRQVSVI